ncbi:FAD-dependent oxidoreductase [Streptomyces avermitilis]|uniref:FAD-dependent oxidoreductase n=1 Tax=Streptomyces avermitilis TaxID=33903 RepID=UPI0033BD9DC5
MTTDTPVLLLTHSDPWVRHQLAKDIERSTSDLEVVTAASKYDAYATLGTMAEHGKYLAAAIADETLVDDTGENLLRGLNERFPTAARAILAPPDSGTDPKVYVMSGKPGRLHSDIGRLQSNSRPPHPRVIVTGPKRSQKADEILAALHRALIPAERVMENREHVTVSIVGTNEELTDPCPGEIFRTLKLVRDPKRLLGHPYDLVIIGAGPAGLSAALNASINVGLSTLIIESQVPGGTATTSINTIDNYLGFPQGIYGPALAQLALEQVANLELVDFLPTLKAQGIMKSTNGRYIVEALNLTSGREVHLKAGMILLACGSRPHELNLARGKDHYPDRGVYYSALPCDQEREKNKTIAIIGGGDSAGQAALQFAEKSRKVIMVPRDGLDRMSPSLKESVTENPKIDTERYVGYEVVEFSGTRQLQAVRVREANSSGSGKIREIRATSAYVLIGGDPDTAWVGKKAPLHCERVAQTTKKYIKTDVYLRPHGNKLPFETSLDGVFAAGDVRVNSLRRVGQAVGQGAAAVASMERYASNNPRILIDKKSPAYTRINVLRLTKP